MEEKIVGKKGGGIFPPFPHLFHSHIYRISLICPHLLCACARPTTSLWFTDIMYQSRHNTTSTKYRTMLANEYTTTIRYQPIPLQCNYLH